MAYKGKLLVLKLSKGVKYTIFATNIVAMILLILSINAPKIAPSSNIFVAYLGLGFPFLLLLNIGYLVLWIISFRWKYIILQVIVLAMCSSTIFTYIAVNPKTKDIPENSIKFMSYNVRGFDWLTGQEARENPVLQYIANSGADIICLQEFAVDDKRGRNRMISLREFDDIMKDYPYRTVVRLGPENEPNIYGLACYSKYPILKQARLPISSAFNGSAMYEIRVGKRKITVVNNHLESNRITAEDKALYKELVLTRRQDKLNDMAQVIQNRMEPAFKTRERQADIIASCIRQQINETYAMIVCGDFNDPPISYAYQTIKGDFIDSFKATGKGLGITYNADGFWFRIDYIMHSRNIKSYNCTVDKVNYSDHYPIYSYISLE